MAKYLLLKHYRGGPEPMPHARVPWGPARRASGLQGPHDGPIGGVEVGRRRGGGGPASSATAPAGRMAPC